MVTFRRWNQAALRNKVLAVLVIFVTLGMAVSSASTNVKANNFDLPPMPTLPGARPPPGNLPEIPPLGESLGKPAEKLNSDTVKTMPKKQMAQETPAVITREALKKNLPSLPALPRLAGEGLPALPSVEEKPALPSLADEGVPALPPLGENPALPSPPTTVKKDIAPPVKGESVAEKAVAPALPSGIEKPSLPRKMAGKPRKKVDPSDIPDLPKLQDDAGKASSETTKRGRRKHLVIPELPRDLAPSETAGNEEDNGLPSAETLLDDVFNDSEESLTKKEKKDLATLEKSISADRKKEGTANYKTQILPGVIYKKSYRKENRHLPASVYKEDLEAYLFDTATRGDINGIRALLDTKLVDPNIQNIYGNTPLMNAALNNNTNAARLLAARGADPNIQNKLGLTSLHIAAQRGNLQVVEALLKIGALPSIENNQGITPLQLATVSKHFDVAKALLDGGANREVRFFSELIQNKSMIRSVKEKEIVHSFRQAADQDRKEKATAEKMKKEAVGTEEAADAIIKALNNAIAEKEPPVKREIIVETPAPPSPPFPAFPPGMKNSMPPPSPPVPHRPMPPYAEPPSVQAPLENAPLEW